MKELKDMSFEEVVQYSQANILLGIPVGKFNDEVWKACNLILIWKQEKEKK